MTIELNTSDLADIRAHGMSERTVREQIMRIEQGYPGAQITSIVKPNNGLRQISDREADQLLRIYDEFEGTRAKFVPASGAASRMFSKLFTYLDNKEQQLESPFECTPEHFAFGDMLSSQLFKTTKKTLQTLYAEKDYATIIRGIIAPEGLRLGDLPKALVPFHRYKQDLIRTPIDEHIVEGIRYAQMPNGEVHVHFTVSPEHLVHIQDYYEQRKEYYEQHYNVRLRITLSIQDPATDTIALTPEGELFRDANGHILFRPGGHGALLANLQALEADIIFIKNIDNVAKEAMQRRSIRYKKILAGTLLTIREQLFNYLRLLTSGHITREELTQLIYFCKHDLTLFLPEKFESEEPERQVNYLLRKLNRPLRVCGLVANEGEPGGGPFWVRERDGSESLQIVEGSQLDMTHPRIQSLVQKSHYFNPVDIVCCTHNYLGERFDLTKFVNPNMGLIVHKSYQGRPLIGIEPPGLWNGAMANWLTIFVEVPSVTFTPVKEVNDLLRPEHLYDPQAPESVE